MKLVLEQPIYSFDRNQEQNKNQLLINQNYLLTNQSRKTVLENKYLINNYSSLIKRIDLYSLSNNSRMTIKNFSEEQTNSIDYDNTYFSSEDLSSSLTTITSNFTKEFLSDTDDISEINDQNSNKDEDSFSLSKSNLIGLDYNKKICSINRQIILDDNIVNHSFDQNQTIRSNIDIVSLNSSITLSSSIPFTDQQLNKQNKINENDDVDEEDEDEYYIVVEQQKSFDQVAMINNNDDDDEYIESTRLYDNGQHDGIHSDDSQYSDDLKYTSNTIQNSYLNDDVSHTSSTLRQEAISLTKIRCKQRQTWLNSSSNILKPYKSNNQVDGTYAITSSYSPRNANMNSPTILSNKNSLDCNKNVETPSYDFLKLNSDHHHHHHRTTKTDESIVSPLLKANNTSDTDALSTANKKTNNFYLIHHQSSLIPIKKFLNQNLHTNIELIQMDEQECILEIVDGVVTLVPKDKSSILKHSDEEDEDDDEEEEEEQQQQQNSIEYETSQNYDSPEREKRSSSIASSISTPSISEHEKEQVHDEILLSSLSSSNKEQNQEPFILLRDNPSKSSPIQSQIDPSVDLLDLFSTPPIIPLSNSNTNNNNEKNHQNLLDDSLSSVSSYEHNESHSESLSEKDKIPPSSSSPSHPAFTKNESKYSSPSTSIKDDLSSNKKSSPLIDEIDIDYPIPKSEPPPQAKPINKARINEFASLLSSAVHLSQPPPQQQQQQQQINKKSSEISKILSPKQSQDRTLSNSDREERESFHTVQSNTTNSELEQTKKPIDARYNEKIDDRKSIQINTSNIKALFEQKIFDTNKALAQSNEHVLHVNENKQQHKKSPVSYSNLKLSSQQIPRRQSFQDSSTMNKYSDHIEGPKDIVIEDKQPEHIPHQTQGYTRRNNTEQLLRPNVDSLMTSSPVTITNGYYSESLIAREIRETKEKEEELRQQRKKCGLPEDLSSLLPSPRTNSIKTDQTSKQPVKNSSFLSNLDFFTSKSTELNSPRRSTVSTQNLIYDSNSTNDIERKSNPSQEYTNNLSVNRINSTNNSIYRSASNQNIPTNNIIQREIEAIRVKEAELRQLGRIQHTSDEHSDPRKYQEFVSPLPKSQSTNILSTTGKIKRDTEKFHGPMAATSNGILKPKTMNYSSSTSSIRGKFPNPNPTAPIISSSNKTIDYSKLSSSDRLELEKRECQEREQELRKQRYSLPGNNLITNEDSGNVSQDEHEENQEHYFDKIQRLKRTENEKAQAPLIRPIKKNNLSQKWEQMVANKANNLTGDDDNDNK